MTVAVRTDQRAAELRAVAKAAATPEQARRLLAMALVLEGASRARRPAAPAWTGRPCATGCIASTPPGRMGLIDRKAPGRQRRLGPEQHDELARCLENGPELAQDGVVRWRLVDLCALVERRFGVRYQERGMGKLVAGAWLQSDLGPAAAPQVRSRSASRVQKKLPDLIAAAVGDKAAGKRLEIWFQDESRIGQKGELTRQWARRGSRPRQPKDQRYTAAYIFAAVCPASRKDRRPRPAPCRHRGHEPASGRDLGPGRRRRPCRGDPRPSRLARRQGAAGARQHHPAVAAALQPGAQPGREPVAVPQAQLPQRPHLRHYDAIVDACCDAWNRLRAIPGQIRSITTRDWAKTVNI